MKYLFTLFFSMGLFATEPLHQKYSVGEIPNKLSLKEKKARFYYLVVPAIYKVYNEFLVEFHSVQTAIKEGKETPQMQNLKAIYHVTTNEELLLALKPHPKSIAIAQAAMESAWGTSRFFTEANNVFGMWSKNSSDKRIAAGEKRGTRTIWLRKFDTIEASVHAYYQTMGRASAYKKFREYRYKSNDVFKIIQGLDTYSELGEEYVKQLEKVIRYNHLTRYDK